MGVVKQAKVERKCLKKFLEKHGREPTKVELDKAVAKKLAKKGETPQKEEKKSAGAVSGGSGDAYIAEHEVQCTRGGTVVSEGLTPCTTFEACGALFGSATATRLSSQFSAPTPVQAMAWPAAAGGGDVIALAKTGSGKTLAYLFPAFATARKAGAGAGGVRVVVLAPTRELAIQISAEAEAWGGSLKSAVIYGGADRRGQQKTLKKGVDCVVATPGRLKDFVDDKTLDLSRVSVCVLDEADRMLDMGFEPQLTAIVAAMDGGAAVERQTLFFSATWPKAVRSLASKYSQAKAVDPLVISIGNAMLGGSEDGLRANKAITQLFRKLGDDEKDAALSDVIDSMKDTDRMICFTNTKRRVDYLAKALWADGFGASAIHGGRTQQEREEALQKFKDHEWPLMFATDVAARGLDLPDVTHVVNFDMPRDVEQYVHRIGRTGRAGKTGTAVTFWNIHYDLECAAALAKIARDAGQVVPDWLDEYAKKGKAGKNWKV